MKKRCIAVLMCIVLTATLLISCDTKDKYEGKEENEEEKQLKIGITFDTFVLERWTRDRDVFVSTA